MSDHGAAPPAEHGFSLMGCFPADPFPHPLLQVEDADGSLDGVLDPGLFAGQAERRQGAAIAGDLASMPFEDLIGLLELGRRTGSLVLHGMGLEARIVLVDGRVVHAVCGGHTGEAAFRRIARDASGPFDFVPGLSGATPPTTIQREVSELFAELGRPAAEDQPLEPPTVGPPGVTAVPGNGVPSRERAWTSLPEPGSVIDKYRIEALIGTGGFGAVYRATHLILRTSVALKLLKPEVVRKNPFLAERLCEEARFAAQLNTPGMVRVFDVTHSPRLTYIVMEYIEGLSLSETLRASGPMDHRRVVWLGLQVCLALKAALAEGLIHRDVKPANILLAKSGAVKIVDLGLAQQVGAETTPEQQSFGGTPNYMAPEQSTDPNRVDFRSDIYALGVTLYQAALGRLPFSGADAMETIRMHQAAPVPLPSALAPGFPAELERLLLWMLEKQPEARPASYDQLLTALDEVLAGMSLGAGGSAGEAAKAR